MIIIMTPSTLTATPMCYAWASCKRAHVNAHIEHILSTWALYGRCMGVVRALYVRLKSPACALYGRCMGVAWALCERCMSKHGSARYPHSFISYLLCMQITWLGRDLLICTFKSLNICHPSCAHSIFKNNISQRRRVLSEWGGICYK